MAKSNSLSRTKHNPLRWRALVFLILGTLSMDAIGEIGNGLMFLFFDFLPTEFWFSENVRGFEDFIGYLIAFGIVAIVTGIYPFIGLKRWRSSQDVMRPTNWPTEERLLLTNGLPIAILVGSLATNIIAKTLIALTLLLFQAVSVQDFLIFLAAAIVLSIYPASVFFRLPHGINNQGVIYGFITVLVTFCVMKIVLNVNSLSLSGAVMAGFFVYQLISRRMAPK